MKLWIVLCMCVGIAAAAQGQDVKEMEDSLENLFYAAVDEGQLKKAEHYIEQGLVALPNSARLYWLRAILQEAEHEIEDALVSYSKAIELDPEFSSAYNHRGIILSDLGQDELAIEDFNKGIEVAKDNDMRGAICANRALPRQHMGDIEGAYQDLKQALVYNPSDLGALANLGWLCVDMGRIEEAIRHLEFGLENHPGHPGLMNNLAFVYIDLEEFDRAIEMFTQIIENYPDDAIAMNNLSYCYFKKGDLKTALKEVNSSLKLNPYNAYAYRNRALMYLEKKDTDKACEDIRQALRYGFTDRWGDEMLELQKAHCF